MPSVPHIDRRRYGELVAEIRRLAPYFEPAWRTGDGDFGDGLTAGFAQMLEHVLANLDRVPQRNHAHFLSVLGVTQLPATPAVTWLRFKPATPIAVSLRVPRGTLVTAQDPDGGDPIPFETERELQTFPGALAAILGVDPEADSVYLPPATFIDLAPGSQALDFDVRAFVAAGSTRMQLDRLGELAEGDLLELGTDGEIARVAGTEGEDVVLLAGPIQLARAEGERVRQVLHFDPWTGYDAQSHRASFGHDELLSIESEAEISVDVVLAAGGSGDALDLDWEAFGTWTEDADPSWGPLVLVADGTQGLSRAGRVVLRKPAGAIVPTEVSGVESRWLRATVRGKLAPGVRLARLERVLLGVQTLAKDLAPDLAYHNATPLATDVGFQPFGQDPRLFDSFFLASEEVFSKAEAKVTLDVGVNNGASEPTAIVVGNTLHVFQGGVGGRLVELQVDRDTGAETFFDRSSPPGVAIVPGSRPAATSTPYGVFVAIRGSDERVHVARLAGGQVEWRSIDPPSGSPLRHSPAISPFPTSPLTLRLFVVDANGSLHVHILNQVGEAIGNWGDLGRPGTAPLASAPHVALLDPGGQLAVLHVLLLDDVGNLARWLSVGGWEASIPAPPSPLQALGDSILDEAGNAVAVAADGNGQIHEFSAPGTWSSSPAPGGVARGTAPETVFGGAGGRELFVVGADGALYRKRGAVWNIHPPPLGTALVGAMLARGHVDVTGTLTAISVAAVTARSTVAVYDFDALQAVATVAVGVNQSVVLVPSADDPLDFVGATLTDGTDTLSIAAFDAGARFAEFTSAWTNVPPVGVSLPLDKRTPGQVNATVTQNTINVEVIDVGANPPAEVRVGAILVVTSGPQAGAELEIQDVQGSLARMTTAWPGMQGDTFQWEIAERATMTVAAASGRTIRIDPGLDPTDLLLGFEGHDPAAPASYDPATGVTALAEGGATPDTGAIYWTSAPPREPPNVTETEADPKLSWEYWNGRGWVRLAGVVDKTRSFLKEGTVTFQVPANLSSIDVAGQKARWIRARLVGGDYGRETYRVVEKDDVQHVESTREGMTPPLITKLGLSYVLDAGVVPDHCLTQSNLGGRDQSAACRAEGTSFRVFEALPDLAPTLYLGFERAFDSGPLRALLHLDERSPVDAGRPELRWELWTGDDWIEVQTDDGTSGLVETGEVQWVAPRASRSETLFGRKDLHWLRGSRTRGSVEDVRLRGVHINSARALQARTVEDELVGSGTGLRGQVLHLVDAPVLEGAELRVREALGEEEREDLVEAFGEKAVARRVGDDAESWVLWTRTRSLLGHGPSDRVYELDAASGEVRFGDGVHGRILLPGVDNVRAFRYRTGGGKRGNVPIASITALVSTIAGIEEVTNPLAAGGGSEQPDLDTMLEIGSEEVGHADRAVAAPDFESIARASSRAVLRARALADTGPDLRPRSGSVHVVLVPDEEGERPQPKLALVRAVREALGARASASLVAADRLSVGGPTYLGIRAVCRVRAAGSDLVGAVRGSVRERVLEVLDWRTRDFGDGVWAADIAAELERIEGVDWVRSVELEVLESDASAPHVVGPAGAFVTVGPNVLATSAEPAVEVDAEGEED